MQLWLWFRKTASKGGVVLDTPGSDSLSVSSNFSSAVFPTWSALKFNFAPHSRRWQSSNHFLHGEITASHVEVVSIASVVIVINLTAPFSSHCHCILFVPADWGSLWYGWHGSHLASRTKVVFFQPRERQRVDACRSFLKRRCFENFLRRSAGPFPWKWK